MMNMLVHKLIILCWLVSTVFGETTIATPTTKGTTEQSTTVQKSSSNQAPWTTSSTSDAPTATTIETSTATVHSSSTTLTLSESTSAKPTITGTTEQSTSTTVQMSSSTQAPSTMSSTSEAPTATTTETSTATVHNSSTTPMLSESTSVKPTITGTTEQSTPTTVQMSSSTQAPSTTSSTSEAPIATTTETSTATVHSSSTTPMLSESTSTKPTITGTTEQSTPTTVKISSSTQAPSTTSFTSEALNPSSSTSVTTNTMPASSPTTTLTPAVTSHSTDSTTSGEPGSIITTTTTTTTQPPATMPSPCSSNPCPFDSLCVELFNGSSTCQCFPGSYFSEGSCLAAKVFAGNLHLMSLSFDPEMNNKKSKIFYDTTTTILAALREALQNESGYIKSDILQLREGSVIATVDNVFKTTSDATQSSFEVALDNYISNCKDNCGPLKNTSLTVLDLCKEVPARCESDTTTCETKDGILSCPCKFGYVSSEFSDRSCTACASGMTAKNDTCVPCPIGYSGFNCNDSSLLAVVVISCVLGGLLLILLLVFLNYYCRTSSQKPESNYNSPYPAQDPRANWSNQQVPKIPRASAIAGWDPSQLEMTESGSTRALVAKGRPGNGVLATYDVGNDDLRTFKGRNPSRYSYLVQGQDNPYFVADEGGTK